jgi:hypothetical protein
VSTNALNAVEAAAPVGMINEMWNIKYENGLAGERLRPTLLTMVFTDAIRRELNNDKD